MKKDAQKGKFEQAAEKPAAVTTADDGQNSLNSVLNNDREGKGGVKGPESKHF